MKPLNKKHFDTVFFRVVNGRKIKKRKDINSYFP